MLPYKRITPAMIMQRLYFLQFVGSENRPSELPHWKGAVVAGGIVVLSGAVGSVVVTIIVVASVVGAVVGVVIV